MRISHILAAILTLLAGTSAGISQTATDSPKASWMTVSPSGSGTFSWWGRSGWTYFLQSTTNVETGPWQYLPVIRTGADQLEQWPFLSSQDRFFVRFRASDLPTNGDPENADFDGDGISNIHELWFGTDPLASDVNTDGDGLADAWEMVTFGNLAHDETTDTDGDGVSDVDEIHAGTGWNDFFNGQQPTVTIILGNNQTGAPSSFVSQPLTVKITNAAGHPYTGGNVIFTVTSGGGTLQKTNLTPPSSTLSVTTDSTGQAKAFFKLPNIPNNTSTITATASSGSMSSSQTFIEQSDDGSGGGGNNGGGGGSPFDPSDIVANVNSDGSADVSWTNNTDPNDTEPINIQYRDRDGNWVTAITVPAGTTSAHVPAQ
jgi:hypothetical protein